MSLYLTHSSNWGRFPDWIGEILGEGKTTLITRRKTSRESAQKLSHKNALQVFELPDNKNFH